MLYFKMKGQDIHIDDLGRILIGNVRGEFYIEVLIRLIIIYAVLIISMRIIGKRISGSLSRNELAAIVVLAAAVGVPMQSPERGMLPGLIIAIIVVFTTIAIAKYASKNPAFEKFSQGNITTLVYKGILDLEAMKKVRISKERVFAQLRARGIINLGAIKRMYWEAGGSFTVVKDDRPRPGLSIIPFKDIEFRSQQQKRADLEVCSDCGEAKRTDDQRCNNCGNGCWENPVV
jgi:uncharacterized membrane protein YcaP (DUF421 family)